MTDASTNTARRATGELHPLGNVGVVEGLWTVKALGPKIIIGHQMEVEMSSKTLGAFLAIAIAASGCGNTADTAATPSDPDAPEIALALDLPYFDEIPGLNTPVLDVFAPADDGPWPIVVTYHQDSFHRTKSFTTNLARAIAEQGAVVINPTYGGA